MVAVSGQHQQSETAEAASTPEPPVASLSARISAYLIDSLALLVVVLVFFTLAGVYLLLADEQSSGDPANSAYYWFTTIFLGGTLTAWSAVNLALLGWRGQTVGMYVVAIRVVSEEGPTSSFRKLTLRWFGLHPLLFHPVLILPWLLLVVLLGSVNANQVLLFIAVGSALLCIVAPAVAAISMFVDPHRRTLNDRFSHTIVSHMESR